MPSRYSNSGRGAKLWLRPQHCKKCGKKAELKISESEANPNGVYFRCGDCYFFKWAGEEHIISNGKDNGRCEWYGEASSVQGPIDGDIGILKKMVARQTKYVKSVVKVAIVMYLVLVLVIVAMKNY